LIIQSNKELDMNEPDFLVVLYTYLSWLFNDSVSIETIAAMINECGAVGGMRNRITLRKPDPMLHCPTQIPNDRPWDRTRPAVVEAGP
jgi:hypothetical protein